MREAAAFQAIDGGQAMDCEKALAAVARELAVELRLTDLVDLVTFIRTDNHPNINDLVNSSAELYLKPGTLCTAGRRKSTCAGPAVLR